jgi:hypothetical protein
MANGIVRLDRVRSVYTGHIDSVVYNAGVLQNGMVGKAASLVSGERELRTLTVPAAGDGGLVLIASPEVNYSQYVQTDNALENFSIPAGKPARAYHLEAGDIFSISYDVLSMIGTDPVVGNSVVAQAGLTLKEVASVTTEKFVGKIIAVETIGINIPMGQAGSVGRINKFAVIEVQYNKLF